MVGMIWPITSQSNKWRNAAKRSFAVGAERAFAKLLDIGGDMHALDRRKLPYSSRGKPVEEFHGRARIGAARVRIADIGGEEFKEAIGGALANGGDEGGGVGR